MKKTKLLVGLFASVALIAGATSCEAIKGTPNGGNNNLTTQQKQNVEALTSIKLLESTLGNGSMIKRAKVFNDNQAINTEDIEKILPSIDVLLNNGSIIESSITEVDTVINETTYKFKEVISYKDSELKDATYTLVYNKEAIGNDKNDDDDDQNDRRVKEAKKEGQDNGVAPETTPDTKPETTPETTPDGKPENNKPNDEIETKEKLVGLVLLSDTEHYDFEAMSKTEIEEDEKESKRSFKISLDENSFVKVTEKSEVEENEKETKFAYKFVKDGKVELDYSLKIEDEKDELTEVTYEVNEIEYEVTKFVKDSKEIYKVEREDVHDNEQDFYFEKIINEDGTSSFVRI